MSNNISIDPQDHKRSKVKMLLPAVVLPITLHYSVMFTEGIVVGYVLCKIFCMFFVEKGRIDSVFLDYGKWKVHLHHWIMGLMVLAAAWTLDYFYLPTFFAGFVCGVILQDIYDYNDWHKILVRKEEVKE